MAVAAVEVVPHSQGRGKPAASIGGRRHDGRVDGAFIPGLRLAGEFYAEAVRPLLDAEFPGLRYAAALLGPGSEVLGFDTERSTDHDWGPRLQRVPRRGRRGAATPGRSTEMLAGRLPSAFRGYPVAFEVTRDPDGGVRHRVEVTGLGGWLAGRLGFDPRPGVTVQDWLATPWQRLAEVTAGRRLPRRPGRAEPGPGRADAGTRTTCGGTCSAASGGGSRRKRRSPAGAPRRATSSAPPSSPPGWRAT